MPKPATTGLAIEDRKVPADPEVTLRIECSDGARGVEHVAVLRRAPLVKYRAGDRPTSASASADRPPRAMHPTKEQPPEARLGVTDTPADPFLPPYSGSPETFRRPHYGVDALQVPVLAGTAALACCLAAARWRTGRIATTTAGVVLLANTGLFLHTTLRGKLRVWERELDRVGLAGNEQLLDLGCGRGAVLIAAARRLPEGRAVGVDLWTSDQSGNSPEATLTNAAAAGVADRVEVHTADMTALPFPDGSFDVVTSALAIHNIPLPDGRYQAVDEAMRVLRPGGQLLVADPWPMARKYAAHIGQGTLRSLGPGYWYGGPWLGVTLLHAIKEE